jgi:hypothetical protein
MQCTSSVRAAPEIGERNERSVGDVSSDSPLQFPALVLQRAGDAGPPDGQGMHAAASPACLLVGVLVLHALRLREEGGPGPGDGADE